MRTQHELHRRSEGPRYRWTLQWEVGGDQHVGLSAAGGDRRAAGDAGRVRTRPACEAHPDRAGTDGNTLRRPRELIRPRDLVRPRVDARHGAGRDVGGPHVPGSEGDLGHTEADGDRSLDGARTGVDSPDHAAGGICRPDGACADGDANEIWGLNPDRLCDAVPPWVDTFHCWPARGVRQEPHAGIACRDRRRPCCGNMRDDGARRWIDPCDRAVGIDGPDSTFTDSDAGKARHTARGTRRMIREGGLCSSPRSSLHRCARGQPFAPQSR